MVGGRGSDIVAHGEEIETERAWERVKTMKNKGNRDQEGTKEKNTTTKEKERENTKTQDNIHKKNT